MRTHIRLIATAVLLTLPGTALAQTDDHHPATEPATTETPAPAAPDADMAAQCAAMMPMIQQMMSMMSTMQQGGMMGSAGDMPAVAGMSEASKAYMDAMTMMSAPMMQGAQNANPDIAFVQAMIAHHEGAIAMTKAVLRYGADDQVKTWASEIVAAQEAEIAKLQEWLASRPQ